MKKLRILGIALFVFGFVACSSISAPASKGISGKTLLVQDPLVTEGKLKNGMTWLVMKNAEPANRIYLRLAVKAGAILEDDDQKGVAHFVEHMAFNGTEHFAKNELVDYFESIGMSFGPEINAYTGFDETVYMLEIPADDPDILEKSLLVLKDWASALSFDQEELDKERGVVLEEWRLGRGAGGRVQDKQIPFLFNGSRYASRLPIGDPEIIKTVTRKRVTDFYKKWYRPEMMSIILVGDADPLVMKEAIQVSLGAIPASKSPQKRPEYAISPQKNPALLVIRDPEIAYTTIQVMEQQGASATKTVDGLRKEIVSELAFSIFNNRLSEKTLVADPLILGAQAGLERIAKPTKFSFLGMVPSNSNFIPAFRQLIKELIRIEKFGVTEAELQRGKQSVLDSIKQTWLDKDKINSGARAGEMVQAVLYGDTMISIQNRYDLYTAIVPQITQADILKTVDSWYTGRGKLLLVTAPDTAADIPADPVLMSEWLRWEPAAPVTAYTENNLDRPLYETPASGSAGTAGPAGSVVKTESVSKNGIQQWILSNGARVIVYPTKFKENEILFSAFSKGGSSLVSDEDFPSAAVASSFAQMSGLNGFSATDLQKKLAGKTVSGGTWIDESFEGLYGSASVTELETLFQLINLEFTKPYFTSDAYEALMAQLTTVARSRKNEPEEVFSDLKTSLLYGSNVRRSNLTEALVAGVKQDAAEKTYLERFSDAGDFTFVFVGSFDEAKLKAFAETYLAALPSTGKKEEARSLGIAFPSGITAENLNMGLDPKSRVFFAFGGKPVIGQWEHELFQSMTSLLDIRLREIIREDMSGSYGVRVRGSLTGYPEPSYEITVEFGCEPGREESLSAAVLEQIRWLENAPVPETYLTKLRENFRRSQEEGLKNNQFWMGNIVTLLMQGRPLDEIDSSRAVVPLITGVKMQEMVKKYLNTENFVKAYLMPKK